MNKQIYTSPLIEVIKIELEDFVLTGSDITNSLGIDPFTDGGDLFE